MDEGRYIKWNWQLDPMTQQDLKVIFCSDIVLSIFQIQFYWLMYLYVYCIVIIGVSRCNMFGTSKFWNFKYRIVLIFFSLRLVGIDTVGCSF